jgi:hypothetical protein
MKVSLGVSAIKVAAERAVRALALKAPPPAPTGIWAVLAPGSTLAAQEKISEHSAALKRAFDLLGVSAHKATGTIIDVEGEDLAAIAQHLEPYESERI